MGTSHGACRFSPGLDGAGPAMAVIESIHRRLPRAGMARRHATTS